MASPTSRFDRAYRLAALCFGLVLVSCAEATAPVDSQMAAKRKSELQSTPTITETTQPKILELVTGAPPLETTETAFWAVQGKRVSVRVNYLDPEVDHPEDGDQQEFLVLTIPRTTQLIDPAGDRLARGDSLLITLKLDSNDLAIKFEPHGLVFDVEPAQLELWYVYADMSEDENGVQVVETDLAIWYQPTKDEPWTRLPTTFSKRGKALDADLDHFSNYAIAW